MRNIYLTAAGIIVLVIIFVLTPGVSSAFFDDDFLWVEFKNEVEAPDLSINQPLLINYGKYPGEDNGLGELSEVEAFYTVGNKDKSGRDIFYRINIEVKEGRSYINIKSKRIGWYKVIVKGSRNSEGRKFEYIAATSFFLFSRYKGPNSDQLVSVKRLNIPLDIKIYRENVKEELTYDRNRIFPVRAVIRYNNMPFSREAVNIIEPSGNIRSVKTDKHGNFVYFPFKVKNQYFGGKNPFVKGPNIGRSRVFNNKEFSQDLILVDCLFDKTIYRNSYTVFFGNKGLVLRRDMHNLTLGLFIFFGASIFTSLFFIKRKSCQL